MKSEKQIGYKNILRPGGAAKLTCWKWFGAVLKEAGVEANDKNKEKIDTVIHKYIGEQSSYGRCSADWRQARTQIADNEKMRKELIGKLKALV